MTKFTRPWDGFPHDKPMRVPKGEQHPRFEFASPYWPESYDNNPQSKLPLLILHTVRDTWNEMHREDPDFFCGLTVHGSLVKGRSHDESDIDPIIYTSKDTVEATLDKYKVIYDRTASYEPTSSAKEFVERRFREVLGAQSKGKPIPESFLRSELWGNMVLPNDYFKRIVPVASKMLKWCLKHNEKTFFPYPVDHLFHLRVGPGRINEYRRDVLDGMGNLSSKKYPNLADSAWQAVRNSVVAVEEWNRGATIYFPETYDEARQYFGL